MIGKFCRSLGPGAPSASPRSFRVTPLSPRSMPSPGIAGEGPLVGEDVVAADRRVAIGAGGVDDPAPVVGDEVALAGRRPSDGDVLVAQGDSPAIVAERDRARGVGADPVALDQVAAIERAAGVADGDAETVDGLSVGRDDVAEDRDRAGVEGHLQPEDVAEPRVARGRRADEIALDRGSGKTVQADAVAVAGDEVSIRGEWTADHQVRAAEPVDAPRVEDSRLARGVDAEKAPLDLAVGRAARADPGQEAVDDEATDRRSVPVECQTRRCRSGRARQHDFQDRVGSSERIGVRRCAGLRVTVDENRARQIRKPGCRDDRAEPRPVTARPGNVERDRVGARRAVGVDDRLTERTRARVGGVRDREGGGEGSGGEGGHQDRERRVTQAPARGAHTFQPFLVQGERGESIPAPGFSPPWAPANTHRRGPPDHWRPNVFTMNVAICPRLALVPGQ